MSIPFTFRLIHHFHYCSTDTPFTGVLYINAFFKYTTRFWCLTRLAFTAPSETGSKCECPTDAMEKLQDCVPSSTTTTTTTTAPTTTTKAEKSTFVARDACCTGAVKFGPILGCAFSGIKPISVIYPYHLFFTSSCCCLYIFFLFPLFCCNF